MVDDLTPEQRSYCMSRIRSKDTKPEIIVRKIAHSLGCRFRLHRRDLPGKPDLTFPGLRKVILVHGCFWHKHRCRAGKVQPSTNRQYWTAKRDRTVQRDREHRLTLRRLGWSVLVVWECDLRRPDRVLSRVSSFLVER
jgi:DNA mismatch endonuclease (patch repair protein)